MRLLLDDTLATAFYTEPLRAGLVTSAIPAHIRLHLSAADLGSGDVGLIPAAEVSGLAESHVVLPEAAVVFDQRGPFALRVPARPDQIEATPVVLYETSGTGEVLARATLEPFYGIPTTAWLREPDGAARAVVVEGAAALHAPEAGFSEDLVRAWFIMTAQPVVSHVAVAPADLPEQDRVAAVDALVALAEAGHEHRKEIRTVLAERDGIDREALVALHAATRLSLQDEDRRALLMLLQRGNKGSAYPYVWHLRFAGEPDAEE